MTSFHAATGCYYEQDGVESYEQTIYDVEGDTVVCDLTASDIPEPGEYYIALIALTDAAGNSSIYYGYDTDVSFWSGDYSVLGLDFTKYNLSNGGALPTVTGIDKQTFIME